MSKYDEFHNSLLTLNTKLTDLEKTCAIRKYSLNRFWKQVGLNVDDLSKLNKYGWYDVPSQYGKRIKAYLDRLGLLEEQREELFKEKPIVYRSISLAPKSLDQRITTWLDKCKNLIEEENLQVPFEGKVVVNLHKVIDGDTYIFEYDKNKYTVRIVGVDTPETCNPKYRKLEHYGYEAWQIVNDLLTSAKVIELRLDKIQLETGIYYDAHGRLLAHVYVDGDSLGEALVAGGVGEALTVFPMEVGIKDQYCVFQDVAKVNNLGLWEVKNKFTEEKSKQSKLNRVIELTELVESYKEVIKISIRDIIQLGLSKSKNSFILHCPTCHYISRIKTFEKDLEKVDGKEVRMCKVCGGDYELLDLINEEI